MQAELQAEIPVRCPAINLQYAIRLHKLQASPITIVVGVLYSDLIMLAGLSPLAAARPISMSSCVASQPASDSARMRVVLVASEPAMLNVYASESWYEHYSEQLKASTLEHSSSQHAFSFVKCLLPANLRVLDKVMDQICVIDDILDAIQFPVHTALVVCGSTA
jgi:hypothetical protein